MKNLKWLVGVLLVFFTIVGCTNQTQPKPNENETPQETEQKEEVSSGFFWKTENEGNTVYLLGSIHIGDDSFYPLDEQIENAFKDSQYLGVEADINKLSEQEIQGLLMQDGIYMDGSTIQDHIDPELYTQLGDKLAEYQLNMEEMKLFKPWFLELFLYGMMSEQLPYDSEKGIDMHFLTNVQENQEIIELESVEMQLNMFRDHPEVQEWVLKDLVNTDQETFTKQTDEMMQVWKSGDLEKLESLALMNDGSEESKVYNELMLDKRNEGMVGKIEEFLNGDSKETYFVVVGAAHYVGEKGIVSLLEDKGYEVERY